MTRMQCQMLRCLEKCSADTSPVRSFASKLLGGFSMAVKREGSVIMNLAQIGAPKAPLCFLEKS